MITTDFYNISYEHSVLGTMILDNSLIEIIAGRISPEIFFNSKNRIFFEKIISDYSTLGCCDFITLSNHKELNVSEIASLTDFEGKKSNWEYYVNELNKLYLARKVKNELQIKLNELKPYNVQDVLNSLDTSLTEYLGTSSGKVNSSQDLVNALIEMMEKNCKNTEPYLGFDLGWENMNDILDGLQLGKLYTIGARPSVGKSSFALQLASNLCKKNVSTVIFSLEMSALSLITRLASVETGIPIPYIQHGWVVKTQSNAERLQKCLASIFEYPLQIYDNEIENEQDLISRIRVQAKTNNAKVFLIDHLGLVNYSGTGLKRHEQIGVITKKLHHLAQELNITIIVLSQLNRGAEGKKPTLAELKDSGTIEENSDIVMFIHRERATGVEEEIPTEILVVKNRDGKCGTANMSFIPKYTKFVEVKKNDL